MHSYSNVGPETNIQIHFNFKLDQYSSKSHEYIDEEPRLQLKTIPLVKIYLSNQLSFGLNHNIKEEIF
jgi:hypothetical protein